MIYDKNRQQKRSADKCLLDAEYDPSWRKVLEQAYRHRFGLEKEIV